MKKKEMKKKCKMAESKKKLLGLVVLISANGIDVV